MGLIASESAKGTTAAIDTTGATLIVVIQRQEGSPATPMSDSEGNTWIELTKYASANFGFGVRGYYCISPTTDASHTFTNGTGAGYALAVLAFDNTGVSYDKVAGAGTAGGTSYTSIAVGASTPGQTTSLVIAGGFAFAAAGDVSALTFGAGWTQGEYFDTPSGDVDLLASYRELTSGADLGGTLGWTTAGEGAATLIFFAADVPAPPGGSVPIFTQQRRRR
ncbi:MAG: hypothetical protein Q8N17_26115 [Burkholderiaceae bacterium]|nr:hypothetical protein [Burkholderiaceae bacterium]